MATVEFELQKTPEPGNDVGDPAITYEQMVSETCDALTGNSLKLFQFLYKRKHKTSYQTLRENIWDKHVQDTSIQTALDRLAKSLNEMTPQYFCVVNEFSNLRAGVETLSQNSSASTDKMTHK